MDILDFLPATKEPEPYEPGEPMFWTDPHISRQMLAIHLDESRDLASYKPGRIDSVCRYLIRRLQLTPGNRVADLGCGPGLYSMRLAQAGFEVTGLDFSDTAIGYARVQAAGMSNAPEFRVENYLDWHETGRYDAALLIYEDYGVLAPADRQKLLANIHSALRSGGAFVLDVASLAAFGKRRAEAEKNWQWLPSGFWRPHLHLVLEHHIFYESGCVGCDRYIVFDSEVKDYRIYQTYYTPQSIKQELESCGFRVEEMLSGLTGEAWREDSMQIGVICRKL